MGKIKKILENELVGGTQSTDVYPVTSVKAVYDENNERLDHILNRRGIVNISTNYNSDHIAEVLTLSQAIAKVPSEDRVLGFQGRFLTGDGWVTYSYTGEELSTWSDTSKWALVADTSTLAYDINDDGGKAASNSLVTKINDRVIGYAYYENTAIDTRQGASTPIGTSSGFDAIIIPVPENTEMEIVGIPVYFENNAICYYSDRPNFSTRDFYISQDTNVNTSGIKFTTPTGAKYIGLSISVSNRIVANKRDSIGVVYYGSNVKNETFDTLKEEVDSISEIINSDTLNVRDLVKANAINVADHNHFFDIGRSLYVITGSHDWACFILPISSGDIFCLGIEPGKVSGVIGLNEIPSITSGSDVDISDLKEDVTYYVEEMNGVYFLTIIDAKNASYIGFTYNRTTSNNKDYCVKVGNAFLTQRDVKPMNDNISSIINSMKIYYPNPITYFDTAESLYCSPPDGIYNFESVIVPIRAGDTILTGIGDMINYKFLSDKPADILPQSGCHDISDLVVQVEDDLVRNIGLNYITYQIPNNIGGAKYLGITLSTSLPAINKFVIVVPKNTLFMTDYDRTRQYMKNMKAISDATKGNALMEFLPMYFDLGQPNHPNGIIGIEAIDWKCIIVPAVKGDLIKVPLTSGLVNPVTLSSYPEFAGDLDEGVVLNKKPFNKVNGSYTEYSIEDDNAKYFSVTVSIDSEVPELPLIIDSGNVTEKELQETKEQIQETKEQIQEAKEQIPFINHDLGMVKNFNFGKYDDICLIMDGQSLSIGWESVAISTTPMDNCYMLGTDPCTLYRETGFNGIGINPLKSVTRESPNVSWCNVMSKLIPNKRFITSSVGEGAKTILALSKTDGTSLVEAEFVGYGTIDPSQGHITFNPGDTTWVSFLLAVQPGETYYITTSFEFLTEYSAKPKWKPIDNDYNNSVFVGNGGLHRFNGQYTVPEGVYYLGLCQNSASYVTKRAFVLKGTADRYEKGFLLPMAQLKAVEDNDNRTIGCPAIVWMQGEGDSGNTKEYYKEKLVKFKNDMQADIMSIFNQDEKPLFFCYMLALTSQKQNTVMMAIAECCEENDDMILIAPIYALPDYNNLHLSSNGNRWYGEYIARSTYNALILGKRDNCVVPYQFVIDGSSIRIKVNAPKLPLVIDTWTVQEVPQYGFKVWKDNIEVTISSITLFGDEITLHCNEDISTGIIEVSYAGYNPSDTVHYGGTGNIRDSDRWQALQTYWDDTDDKGTEVNDSEITYRPKTKEGESLIGKLYPMQNWLQNFYKKLN